MVRIVELLYPKDIISCSEVDTEWRDIFKSNIVWKRFLEDKNVNGHEGYFLKYKQQVKNRYEKEKSKIHDLHKNIFKTRIKTYGSFFIIMFLGFMFLNLSLYILIHRYNMTYDNFISNYANMWNSYCIGGKYFNYLKNVNNVDINAFNDVIAIIILLLLGWVIPCTVYPIFYVCLYGFEYIFTVLGRYVFVWLPLDLESHKTTSVFLGWNTLTLLSILCTMIFWISVWMSYKKHLTQLKHQIKNSYVISNK